MYKTGRCSLCSKHHLKHCFIMFKIQTNIFCVLLVICHILANVSSVQRQLVVYNNRLSSNASFWLGTTDDLPSIVDVPQFANAEQMLCCNQGAWMSYAGADYTEGGQILTDNADCKISIGNRKSFRSLGSTDTATSTISLFESINLEGQMSQYTTDVSYFEGSFKSITVTYPGEATLYTKPNYLGLSICLKPGQYDTFFEWDTSLLGIPADSIQSFKLGCDSTNIYSKSKSATHTDA